MRVEYGNIRLLPSVIISTASFFIAIRTLSVPDIMVVTKAISTYHFERTIRKKGRHRRCRGYDRGRWDVEAGVRRRSRGSV